MDFKQLQSFAAVVRTGSFSRAAEELFISQPTISTHIRLLEEEMNTRLLLRTTKKLEVTPRGRLVYDYACRILELRDRMVSECSAESRHILHLGASTIPSAYILPEVLPAFGREHPETYFVVQQSDSRGVIEGLRDGRFDLGLIGMPAPEDEFVSVPFCEDRIVFITPVNEHYLTLTASPDPLPALLAEPIILREEGSGSKKAAARFLEKCGISEEDLNVVARVNDQEAIKNFVAGGLGVSMISERAARDMVEAHRLLMADLPEGGAVRSLYIVYRRGYILSGPSRAFISFLEKELN